MSKPSPPDSTAPPKKSRRRLPRLDQQMLLGTVMLVVAIVSLSGAMQAISARTELDEQARAGQARMEKQAREIERLVAHMLAITSAASLRDNNYAFLAELVGPLVGPEILRVRILDKEKHAVADTAGLQAPPPAASADDSWVAAEYEGHPVLEYQEAIRSEGQPAGSVIIVYSLEPLRAQLAHLDKVKRTVVRRIEVRSLVLGFSFMLLGVVLAAFQSRRITQPLAALTREALRLARGNLNARVAESHKAGKEVFMLGNVFNYMADQMSLLLDEARLRAQLDHQVQVARAVQEGLLPPTGPSQMGKLRFAGVVAPAEQCGGDWWAHLPLDEHHLALCIGDVTGHGLSTALIAAAACSGFVSSVDRLRGRFDSTQVLDGLNRTIFVMGRGEHQMTATVAVIDVANGAIEVSNGAHPFPMRYNRKTRQSSAIVTKGPRIGDSAEAKFVPVRLQLEPEDVLLWFSDGVVEAENPHGFPFGYKRLRLALERYAHLPAEQLLEAIISEVALFTNSAPQEDDVTLVVAEFAPWAARAGELAT